MREAYDYSTALSEEPRDFFTPITQKLLFTHWSVFFHEAYKPLRHEAWYTLLTYLSSLSRNPNFTYHSVACAVSPTNSWLLLVKEDACALGLYW